MVLRFSEIDGPPKPPPSQPRAAAAGPSFSVPFKNPTLRWGSTRILRCQQVPGHSDSDTTDRRPSSAPPSPPPQTKSDRSPPSSRPRLVIRIACQTQPKEPERDGPPAPQERRDCRQDARTAGVGLTAVEIGRPVSGPVTRSLRSKAGAEGNEKTANTVRPAEFSLSLSKEEIIEDFIAMTGAKPPRRPKQRPRPLQKKLMGIFPGSDLPNIVAPDLYRVSDSSQ